MSDEARSFLDDLVDEVEGEIANPSKPEPQAAVASVPMVANKSSDALDQNIVSIATPPEGSKSSKRSGRKRSKDNDHSHAKARVQKSIRFLPHLIVKLDEYLATEDAEGGRTIQTVMNQALELWLKTNVRKR